jgi:hypothetical protein
VGTIPEGNARLWEDIGNRHESRTDDTKGMFDSVALKHFHKGFFGGHFHDQDLPEKSASSFGGVCVEGKSCKGVRIGPVFQAK